jgi:hypothetical protein
LVISYLRNSQMKNYRLLTIIGAALASFFSSWLPVTAQTYEGASTYRDTDTIYKVGLTPNSTVSVVYGDIPVSKTVYSDACGVLKISIPTLRGDTSIVVNGTAYNPNSTIASSVNSDKSATYKCSNGGIKYSNFTPSGSVFTLGKAPASYSLYLTGQALTGGANKASLVTYVTSIQKDLKVNACGFIAIKSLPRTPFKDTSKVSISRSALIAFDSLPTNPTPPICADNKTYSSSTAPTTYMGAALYRTSKAVYYTGLAPKSSNAIELNSLASKDVSPYKGTSSLPVTPCGVFQIKFGTKSISSLKIGTTNYTVANLPVITAGGCSASELATITPNTLYRLNSSGNAGQTEFVYRVSDVNQKKLTTFYPTIVSRNAIVNACGFAEIKSLDTTNGFNGTDKVKINGAEYVVASLPLAPAAPICKNGVTYKAS